MQLEDYFDFIGPDDIRVKGTRVGIESILYEYIHRKLSAEEIEPKFRTVTLEQVYATILYYLHNREAVGKYFADWLEWSHQQHATLSSGNESASRNYTIAGTDSKIRTGSRSRSTQSTASPKGISSTGKHQLALASDDDEYQDYITHLPLH